VITRINTVSVFVTDQDRSRDFYANQLGFEVLMDAPMGQGRWIQLAPKGAQTSLVLMKPTEDMPADVHAKSKSLIGGFTNFIFAVDDIQATYNDLSARGVEFADKPAQQPWGWWAAIKDPDGNIIGLHQ
jgi:predicted enzyme related to lactoylglutathione lyase